MRKFRINELTSSNDGVGSNGYQHNRMQSPSSLSLASSSTSINHQITPDVLRQSLANNSNNNNVTNMVHSSAAPQRANHQFYNLGENHFVQSRNDNINWRDEADGSEEEECRINWLPSSSELPPPPPLPQNMQSNLFGQHNSLSSNLLTHSVAPLYSTMAEPDVRSQGLNNNGHIDRAHADKNLESNFKEKQLRETEFCINRIEDLLSSFKNLWKTDEMDQLNGNGFGGHVNNINSNLPTTSSTGQRNSSTTIPKMINNSGAFNQSGNTRVSNLFDGLRHHTPTRLSDGYAKENLRNSKNMSRKLFGNNRRPVSSDLNPELLNETTDFNEPLLPENSHTAPDERVVQFYSLLNAQINTLHNRLEQLALTTENSSKANYSQANPCNLTENLPSATPHYSLCDIENCCVPSLASSLTENSNEQVHKFNEQIYQLLMLQNYQINQQHKLIESWLETQQKWIEKHPGISFRAPTFGAHNHTHSHAHNHRHPIFVNANGNQMSNMFLNENPLVNNYRHARPDITLNNLSEPRSRANNFFDNFRSHTHQNKLQPNRDIISQPINREPFTSNNHGTNCSNSCINMNGPCNKNSRSQFFAGFGGAESTSKSQHNIFATSNHGLTFQQPNSSSHFSATPSTSSMMLGSFDKKLNTTSTTTSRGNNNQSLGKNTIVKTAETDSNTKTNLSSSFTSPLNSSGDHKNSSLKRKKTSNVSNSVDPSTFSTESHSFHEDVCEVNDEEDDHDSVDLEPSVFDTSSTRGNRNSQNESGIFNTSSGSANSFGPSTSQSNAFHMDKCSFQVPLTILPHTGAIRKKPLYDNFKFAATDHQKLSVMQHHTQEKSDSNSSGTGNSSNENIRPLMPAEGRSSNQMNVAAPAPTSMINVAKPKLSNSLQKYSKRPPIAGAGIESTGSSSKESMVKSGLDDDIKWNQLNGSDSYNSNGSADLMPSSSSNDVNVGQNETVDSPCSNSGSSDGSEMVSRVEQLSSTCLLEDERLMDGSTEPEPSPSPSKSKLKNGESSSFMVSSSGLVNLNQSSATCTSTTGHNNCSSSSANNGASSVEAQHLTRATTNSDNVVNGRFLTEQVDRVNGHHQMEGNDNLEEDREIEVRMVPLPPTNAVEVRSTVRLSGDGEQGL